MNRGPLSASAPHPTCCCARELRPERQEPHFDVLFFSLHGRPPNTEPPTSDCSQLWAPTTVEDILRTRINILPRDTSPPSLSPPRTRFLQRYPATIPIDQTTAMMDDFVSESESDYTSYWRDWVSLISRTSSLPRVRLCARGTKTKWLPFCTRRPFVFCPPRFARAGSLQSCRAPSLCAVHPSSLDHQPAETQINSRPWTANGS